MRDTDPIRLLNPVKITMREETEGTLEVLRLCKHNDKRERVSTKKTNKLDQIIIGFSKKVYF